MTAPVRLQRYLAAAGVAARRKAEEMITAGRVTVNGEIVRVLGTKIDPDNDAVTVDGEAVAALDHFYVLFNKPKGCITAVSDDRGRPTVMDYLPNVPVPVKPVGRLDFYSEGVLLLTNDGELAARLLAPASHVPKTYHVKIHGQLEPEHLRKLRDGVTLDDGTVTMPAEVEKLPGESKHTWLAITIHEGKQRQIHRMIESLGFFVDKLQRVAFASLTFHGLRVGDARELTQQELNDLRDSVGLDHSAVARGRWRAKREATDIPRRARAKAREEAGFTDTGDDEDVSRDESEAAPSAPSRSSAPDDRSSARGPGSPRRDDRGGARGFGSRSGGRNEGGPRGFGSKSGGRDEGGARGFGSKSSGRDEGGARGFGSRTGGRDEGGARGFGSRSGENRGGSRGFGSRTGGRDEGGARGFGPRSGGDRGGARGFGSRAGGDERGSGSSRDSAGARGGGPGGARGERPGRGGPRGGGPGGPRGGGPGGPRSGGPGGPRSSGGGGPRSGGPAGGRGERPARGGQGRTFGKRAPRR